MKYSFDVSKLIYLFYKTEIGNNIFYLFNIVCKDPVFFSKAYKLPHMFMSKFKNLTAL